MVQRIPPSPENNKAAVKMQGMYRKKKAVQTVDMLKKISGELRDLEEEGEEKPSPRGGEVAARLEAASQEAAAAAAALSGSATGEMWECLACTFLNEGSRQTCEMCDMPRQKETVVLSGPAEGKDEAVAAVEGAAEAQQEVVETIADPAPIADPEAPFLDEAVAALKE